MLGLGAFSIRQLDDYNRVTGEIRDRWLQSTRILGDLNNDTSDFRAAEGSFLLADTALERRDSIREMALLDESITHSLERYRKIRHDDAEDLMYRDFLTHWRDYRVTVNQVETSETQGRNLYRTRSRQVYNRASEALGRLTQWNLVGARNAAERESATYRDAYGWIVAAIFMAGVLLFAAIGFITRSVSDPLLRLAQCMRRIANRETTVPIQGLERSDEIGVMARSVEIFRNNVLELLQSQHDLAEQTKTLEKSLAHEQELTQQQQNFVLMTSHEFRTPLSLIDGHAQRLIKAKERLSTEDIAERAQKIRTASQRMTTLLDSLHRAMQGQEELAFQLAPFDLKALLLKLTQEYQEVRPNLRLLANLDRLAIPLVGDEKQLTQAFSNLLSNAVKYSHEQGIIEIHGEQEIHRTLVEITDHGIGIPAKDIPHIFQRYFRGSNVASITGTGMGLSLAHHILTQHGGTLTVVSEEGNGTTFRVTLKEMSVPTP